MKQRITLFHKAEDSIDPKSIKVSKDAVQLEKLRAAREDKVTFALDDLPDELREVLKQSHELHLRYVGREPYESASPLNSRLSPGLHVLYSPQRDAVGTEVLCPFLRKTFDISRELCISPEKSFTKLPTQRFHHSSSLQYYLPHTHFSSTSPFDYLLSLCPSNSKLCLSRVSLLKSASYIDLDYDTITHALILTAYSPPPASPLPLHLSTPSSTTSRLEVGLLNEVAPPEDEYEHISVGGFLTTIGDGNDANAHPSPTLFSFPSRHHPHSGTFTSKFLTPTGLHPTIQLRIKGTSEPNTLGTCKLHAYFTLPSPLFPDRYQLQDTLFLRSHNLTALRYLTTPVDLEAPDYAVSLWGSSLLLELASPSSSIIPPDHSKSTTKIASHVKEQEFTATVPLHARYLRPSPSGYRTVAIPAPVVFWACTAEEGTKFGVNPFERVGLGYEGLFGVRTAFYHLSPTLSDAPALQEVNGDTDWGGSGSGSGNREGGGEWYGKDSLYMPLRIPVLKLGSEPGKVERLIDVGTAVVIVVGFLVVCGVLMRGIWKEGYGRVYEHVIVEKGDEKKEGKKTQ